MYTYNNVSQYITINHNYSQHISLLTINIAIYLYNLLIVPQGHPEYTIDGQYGYTLDGSVMFIYDGYTYLVGGWPTPLKNMTSSVGIMTFPIYGKIKFMFQMTNQYTYNNYTCISIYLYRYIIYLYITKLTITSNMVVW